MGESRKTLSFAGIATLLAVVALLSAPRRITPGAFSDVGEAFFPEFHGP